MKNEKLGWSLLNDREELRAYLLKLLEVTVLLIFILIALATFLRFLTYILPFVIGFLAAMVLLPIERLFERMGMSRRVSIVVTLIIVIGVIVGLAGLLIVQGAEEAAGLLQVLPHYMNSWKTWFESTLRQGMTAYGHLPPQFISAIQSTSASSLEQLRLFLISFLTSVFADVALLPNLIFVIIISVIAAYFFMADRDILLRGWHRILPPGWGSKLSGVVNDVGQALVGLLRAQLILIGVTSLLCVVGLSLMRIPYSLILGGMIGLTGWVPIVGSGIVTFPWAIGALALGNYVLAIKILLLQATASLVRHTIEPKLLASNMGIGTFATMFGMYVGLTSMGIIGLLVGPIAVIAIRSLIRARMFIDFFPPKVEDSDDRDQT